MAEATRRGKLRSNSVDSITGENVDFSEYEGTLSLVVNVASR